MNDKLVMWIIESNYRGSWEPFGSYERNESDARHYYQGLKEDCTPDWDFRLVKLTFTALEREVVEPATTEKWSNQ